MMKCDRCGRATAYEQFFGNQEHFWGWRCIFCGEIRKSKVLEVLIECFKIKGTSNNYHFVTPA
jgi:hypothetical protein